MSLALTARRALLTPPWVKNELWRRARAVPSLDQRFAESRSLIDAVSGQQLITFTRASDGTFVGSNGLIQTAGTNVPRFTHDPVTLESLGLLVEEQRTNLLLRSEEFDNASWTLGAATVTANAISAPSGSTSADQLIETTATANHEVSQFFAPAANTSYTFSCHLKADSSSTCGLRFSAGLTGSGVICSVDLIAKTATITSGTGTASIATLADGWFRVSLTATASPSPSSTFAYVFRALGTTGSTSNRIYLWGAQLEAGAFATSYIPTTTATVTRSADVASISGSNFNSWANLGGGTIYSESSIVRSGIQTQFVYHLDGALYDISLRQPQATADQFRANIGNTFTPSPGTGGNLSAGTSKAAIAYSGTAGILQVGSAFNDVTMAGALDATQLFVGSLNASSQLNGTIKRLTYWPRRLDNTTLQALTQ